MVLFSRLNIIINNVIDRTIHDLASRELVCISVLKLPAATASGLRRPEYPYDWEEPEDIVNDTLSDGAQGLHPHFILHVAILTSPNSKRN